MKKGEDKIYSLGDKYCMAVAGETCDWDWFASYIQRNVDFYTYKNGYKLDLEAIAQFTWRTLADALREGPY